MNLLARGRAPALLCLVLVGGIARSQTPLDLQECLAMARERSPRLHSIRNMLRSISLSHDELKTTALPQIRLLAEPVFAPASTAFGYDPTVTDFGQVSAQLSLQQSVYDRGIRSVRFDQIQLDLDRMGKEYRRADWELTFAVKEAFYRTLEAEGDLRLLEKSVRQLEEYLEIVTRLSKGGNASLTDVLKTQVQLANARIEQHKARDELGASKYALADVIGASIDTSFTISGNWDDAGRVADSLLAIPEPGEIDNLDLAIADLEAQRAGLDAEIARRENLPAVTLDADAGYLSSGSNLTVDPENRYRALGFSLGLSFDLPLVTWGGPGLRAEQREIDVQNLRLAWQLMRRSLTSELKSTRLHIAEVRERLELIERNQRVAEDNYLLTESKYIGGEALSSEVLSAQQLLTEIRLSELASRAELQLLFAKYERLTVR